MLVNTEFNNNHADDRGGGLLNISSKLEMHNTTFAVNTAPSGGAIYNHASKPMIYNSIFWDNGSDPFEEYYNSKALVSDSLIQHGCPADITCSGVILDQDPLFIMQSNSDYSNLRLKSDSPAIDAGNDTHLPAGITTDLDGNSRIVGEGLDLGAYEFPELSLSLWLPVVLK